MCVCMCVLAREKEREREKEGGEDGQRMVVAWYAQ